MAIDPTCWLWAGVVALGVVLLPHPALAQSLPQSQHANRPADRQMGSVQVAQIGSQRRYPAGQVLGGYRNPYAYPYYRYMPRRYPFGNGPYGPYGSNYGGYSGNAYYPGVYGRPLPIAPPAPDDAPAPPAAPALPVPPPQAGPVPPALSQPVPGLPAQPVPNANPGYGDPAPYAGGAMYNPTYGASQYFGTYPYGFTMNEMWYGHNGRVHGFGAYPALDYPYVYGPPSGFGFYSSPYAPADFADPQRNFGPTYPAVGGINGGAGFSPGW